MTSRTQPAIGDRDLGLARVPPAQVRLYVTA